MTNLNSWQSWTQFRDYLFLEAFPEEPSMSQACPKSLFYVLMAPSSYILLHHV